MGFNDVSVARSAPIENWDKSVFDVVQQLYKKTQTNKQNHFIVNPIYGPEPISGSTRLINPQIQELIDRRMKGGTVTKILLDSIFAKFFFQVKQVPVTLNC